MRAFGSTDSWALAPNLATTLSQFVLQVVKTDRLVEAASSSYGTHMPRQAFVNDMKLHVEAAESVYYPDVFVWCGSPTAGAALTANDATFIPEVLSPSTVEIDRREKLAAYMRLPSLRAYAVVSQEQHRVELHLRGDDGRWALAVLTEADDLPSTPGLPGPGVRLAELYAGTDVAF